MSAEVKGIARVLRAVSVIDGAGVRLHRLIGSPRLSHVDPFVLLDEFKSDNPGDYIAGFPDHPHRGIETITYMLEGRFRHRDSRGGGGLLSPGCVQWMTAGKGIVHSEMPEMEDGQLWGYQLWLSLASKDKMIEPRYQHLGPEDIPTVESEGATVKVISGSFQGSDGPALTRFPVTYLDVQLGQGARFRAAGGQNENSFFYIRSGALIAENDGRRQSLSAGELALLEQGETVTLRAGEASGLLYFSSAAHNEPIVRGGPFVMNSEEEIRQAFLDYQNGTLF